MSIANILRILDDRRLRRGATIAVVVLSVAAAAIQVFRSEYFTYLMWADRDLIRAAALPEAFQVWGAELNRLNGSRAPGGIVYYIYYLLYVVLHDVQRIFDAINAAYIVSTAVLAFAVYRLGGLFAASLSFLLIICSPVSLVVTEELWNPVVGYIFCILAVVTFLAALRRPSNAAIFLTFLLLTLATQAQMANGAVLLSFFVVLVRAHPMRAISLAALAVLLSFLPLLTSQILGFPVAEGVPGQEAAFLGNAGGVPDLKPMLLKAWSNFSVFRRGQLQVNMPMLTIALAIAMMLVLRADGADRHDARDAGPDRIGIVRVFVFTYFLSFVVMTAASPYSTGATIIIGLMGDWHRYSAPMIPISAVFLSLGIPLLARALTKVRWRVLFLALAAWLSLDLIGSLAFDAYGYYANKQSGGNYGSGRRFHRYNQLSDMLADAQRTYGFSRRDLLDRVALMEVFNGQVVPAVRQAEFLIAQMKDVTGDNAVPGCILVLSRQTGNPYARRDKAEIDGIVRGIGRNGTAGLPAADFADMETVMRPDYAMVRYRPAHPNCAKTLRSQFVLTDREKDTLRLLGAAPADRNLVRKVDGRTAYVGQLAMPDGGYPLTFMVELAGKPDGSADWTLRSKQLRNSIFSELALSGEVLLASRTNRAKVGYLASTFIADSRIILTGADGTAVAFPIFEGRLGDQGALAPWRSAERQLPSGTYRAVLKIGALGRFGGPSRERELVLDSALEVGGKRRP